jgi:metal-dependent amidase/aminoacylase/carboxypeptidase family protein
MQLVDDVVAMKDEITGWRRSLHSDPELLFDVHNTAAFVAEKLRAFGCDDVVTGIGRTGVVGIIHGRPGGNGPAIGLRADMDALPIEETTGAPGLQRPPARCTPADMTVIQPCFSAPPNTWQQRVTSPVLSP